MLSIARHAPAKINLALHVTGRQADGFHLLESLVVFTRYGDSITVAASRDDSFSVSGPFADAVPDDGGNLVLKARDRLRDGTLPPCGPVAITLEKNLPAASGIGGGSSDAAATLASLARLWGIGDDGMAAAARGLGADVPMCLAARPLMARGIGQDIREVEAFPALWMVLVNPGVPVSTPHVFRALSCRDNPPLMPLPRRPDLDSVLSWLAVTRNDLETPAMTIAPPVATALSVLSRNGAAFARMSGSGATCFGIFATETAAARAAMAIAAAEPSWFVVSTRTTASGENFDD
ncbi:4-diphosphocytidyl-2-C-methyl-D-erythritol kinase [Mesorhizobium sp. L-8-10]|uniref:4-(cytidine 5'-diphospho)-2-C-methyl-D-erythritol kinase n=1 Tax=Mesorhizobium sp. L-8-10 TaxID=2744523 RepID=UPI0019290611|nr:4-(cytidine 5'-diphospho)-2-C-methyl-D-erythritol kinase [Mesorhizobium sp. L-8-10]BCH34200.1 4-diphosphocytidyl-2-C-methyl-D-erythritol kinase [Mesorhizobium sp. L-8-10]